FLGSIMNLHIPHENKRIGLDASFHGESVVNRGRGTFARNWSSQNLNGVPEHSKHGSEEEDDDDENGL
ncbi:hypothetical protein VYU27_010006, partial [Nannochloropsis oceanica]